MVRIISEFVVIVLIVLLLLSSGICQAQSIKRSVITSIGATHSGANVTLHSTFGQPPNAGTISNDDNYLRQGFQQPLCANKPRATFALDNMTSCLGSTVEIEYTGFLEPGTEVVWLFPNASSVDTSNISNPQVEYDQLGEQTIQLMVTTGLCVDVSTARVTITDSLVAEYSLTDVSCADSCNGSVFITSLNGTAPYTYTWSTGDDDEGITELCLDTYSLSVIDDNGCRYSNNFIIEEADPSNCLEVELTIYNTYTPNGDGVNDTWFIDGLGLYPANKLTIMNRWGNVVFEAEPYINDWDGRSSTENEFLPSATYWYLLRLGDVAGTVLTGDVTILR